MAEPNPNFQLGFLPHRPHTKSMPTHAATQPPQPKPAAAASPILDRFRDRLKEREERFEEGFVPPLSTEEIVGLYEAVLCELTFNSKPLITDLTIIAGEQQEHGEGITSAVCARIIEVPAEQKLPSLYLLDSIVKNIGRDYVRYFASRLPEVFCEAYRQVPPNLYPSMRHLFGTWSTVFPSSVLRQIEDELEFSPPANQQSSGLASIRSSESPRPTHGIHVNPKYLEARRQFDNSSVNSNIQRAKVAPGIKLYGQNSPARYGDYDSKQGESATATDPGSQRFSSAGYGSRTSSLLMTDKLLPSGMGPTRPFSPSSDEYSVLTSPGRTVERASPSRPGYAYGCNRFMGRDEESGEWQKRRVPLDHHRGFENAPSFNGYDRYGPRALIDAYGHDNGQRSLNHKSLGGARQTMNGTGSMVAARSWKNTEEEEFDWEDMQPSVKDQRSSDLIPSSAPSGGFQSRPGLDIRGTTTVNSKFRRTEWANHTKLPMDDSEKISEDAIPLPSRASASVSDPAGHSDGAWKSRQSHSESFHIPPIVERDRVPQLTFAASGASSFAIERQPPHADRFTDSDIQLARRSHIEHGPGSLPLESPGATAPPAVAPTSAGLRPAGGLHNIPPVPPPYLHHKPLGDQFEFVNPSNRVMNQGPQSIDNSNNKNPGSVMAPQLLNNAHPGHILAHPPIHPRVSLHQQLPPLQEPWQRPAVSSSVMPLPSHAIMPPSNHGYTPLGLGPAPRNIMMNPMPGFRPSLPFQNVPGGSLQIPGTLPPLPPGPPPPSQILPLRQTSGTVSNPPPANAFSGLISSLVAQGLISLSNKAPEQDALGVEFDLDLLKSRHESAIRALYEDLPRQCSACGLRFKTQEEHSKHMDWHVAKNRTSKNRKHNLSRKWFVTTAMWLSSAEAVGTDAAPGFFPVEADEPEKKDDEEMAVPADEDQNACALCGEPFEDFYSDETEEWMYKGAAYLNAPPSGSVAGLDRSQLGPIVHAKCRSESSTALPQNSGQEGGFSDEGNERKRLKS